MHRHVPLNGQCNFRDLGGYAAADGRTVKWGTVYRSGELSQLDDGDVAKLAEVGIRTVIDLRSTEEVSARGEARVPDGVEVVAAPIASAALGSKLMPLMLKGDFSQVPENLLHKVNRKLVTDCQEQFGQLLRAVADPARRPLVFNCTQGKDRTGFGAAVVLSALGVSWDAVVEDYLLSNRYRKEDNEKLLHMIRKFAQQQHGAAGDSQDVESADVDLSRISALLVVEAENLNAAREKVIEGYGSFEAYITEGLGLGARHLAGLRDDLLVAPEASPSA